MQPGGWLLVLTTWKEVRWVPTLTLEVGVLFLGAMALGLREVPKVTPPVNVGTTSA